MGLERPQWGQYPQWGHLSLAIGEVFPALVIQGVGLDSETLDGDTGFHGESVHECADLLDEVALKRRLLAV